MKKSQKTFILSSLIVVLLAGITFSSADAYERRKRDDVKVIRYSDGATIIHGCPGEGMRTVTTSAGLTQNSAEKEGNNILIYDCQNTTRRTGSSRSRRNEARVIPYDSNATISYVTPRGNIRTPKTSSSLVTDTNTPKNILIYDSSRTKRSSIPGINNRIGITSSGINININQNIRTQRSSTSIILR